MIITDSSYYWFDLPEDGVNVTTAGDLVLLSSSKSTSVSQV